MGGETTIEVKGSDVERAKRPSLENPVSGDVPERIAVDAPPSRKIGAMVAYIPRPGEGRGGRHEFPAMVMGGKGDSLDLLVFYDATDFGDRQSIPLQEPDHPFPAWKPIDGSATIDGLREELERLKRLVLGDWNDPDQSMMDYLFDFEKKLKAFAKASKG